MGFSGVGASTFSTMVRLSPSLYSLLLIRKRSVALWPISSTQCLVGFEGLSSRLPPPPVVSGNLFRAISWLLQAGVGSTGINWSSMEYWFLQSQYFSRQREVQYCGVGKPKHWTPSPAGLKGIPSTTSEFLASLTSKSLVSSTSKSLTDFTRSPTTQKY